MPEKDYSRMTSGEPITDQLVEQLADGLSTTLPLPNLRESSKVRCVECVGARRVGRGGRIVEEGELDDGDA